MEEVLADFGLAMDDFRKMAETPGAGRPPRCCVPSIFFWKELPRALRDALKNSAAKGENMNKQHAHQLLDQLDPGQFEAVARLLEVMTDPAIVSIANAPIDDEPVSEEEERAVAASKEWFKHNRGIPFEEVVTELGFTMEQVRGDKERV
jgi:hypothetical protein